MVWGTFLDQRPLEALGGKDVVGGTWDLVVLKGLL